MRKNYIVKILFGALTIAGLYSCKQREHPPSAHKEITVDSSVVALSKPVNAEIVSTISSIVPEKGMRIYSVPLNGTVAYDTRKKVMISSRVSGRIERLNIKYNYQPVRKGELIMEIYSPDLAAAQRELLMISKSADNDNMLIRAKQRLQLLGMNQSQIEQVIRSGNILYRIPVYSNANGYILEQSASVANSVSVAAPSSSSDNMGSMGGATTPSPAAPATTNSNTSPIMLREGQYVNAGEALFTIYENGNLIAEFALNPEIAACVKKGQKLLFYSASAKENMMQGVIGLIEPVLQSGRNFSVVRVYLNSTEFKPGQLLVGHLPVVFNKGFWVPKQAVWQLGSRSVVFKKQNNAYVPVDVEVGVAMKEMLQVNTDIGDWQIASNAYYLVDSESFIKSKQVNE